jgi:hypothetical protein
MYNYYIKIDENNNVIDRFSEGTQSPDQDSIFVGQNIERIFNLDLIIEIGDFNLYRYIYENDTYREKTQNEIDNELSILKNDNNNKIKKFKRLRLARLAQIQWVFTMINGEKIASDVGDINEDDKIITPQLRKAWHDVQKHLLHKHLTTDWNNTNYDDIHYGNIKKK